MQSFSSLMNPEAIITTLGTLGVIIVIFMETGLFFGFFFPGDSLLFTAGFLASQGYAPFVWLLVGTFMAAVLGDSVGYAFGKKAGPAIFVRDDSIFFNKKHISSSIIFARPYNSKSILFSKLFSFKIFQDC